MGIKIADIKKLFKKRGASSKTKVVSKAKEEMPKKKLRLDLIIFGVLIFILGVFLGVFIGVGISEGEISFYTFQRFFSGDGEIIVEDVLDNSSDSQNQGIVIDNSLVSDSDGGIIAGGGSADSNQGGTSEVVHVDDGGGSSESSGTSFDNDEDNYVVRDNTTYID